jgi:transposase InsO family protein
MAGDDHPGGTVSLQPSHRPKACLQASVVGLDWVVRVDLRVVEGSRQQLVEHAGVDRVAPHPDLVERQFTAQAPDRLWVADVSYIPTVDGWLYLATILDCFSRSIAGWSMASHLRTELVVDALDMATSRRRPAPGLIHHSDQGSQYIALAFTRRMRSAGIDGSMDRSPTPWVTPPRRASSPR